MIDKNSIIHPGAKIATSASVGPFCVIFDLFTKYQKSQKRRFWPKSVFREGTSEKIARP